MNVKVVFKCVAVLAVGALLLAGGASAQTIGVVKVSNALEGGVGGVSAARCGSTVVVGFADAEPTRPNSYAGVAVSKNSGVSFSDRGTLPVPPPDLDFGPYVLGTNSASFFGASNPALACANSNLFYYASAYDTPGIICSFVRCTAISISTSTDGGTNWGLPVVASVQGEDVFEFVSPTMAVDPTNPAHLYIAYIDSQVSSIFNDCLPSAYALDVVQSFDGGKSWAFPVFVDHSCGGFVNDPTLEGSLAAPNIIVSPEGHVYLTYQFVGAQFFVGNQHFVNPNEIRFLRSLDHGNSFSAPLKLSMDATSNALPQLGVDRTNSGRRGAIYLTWSGAPSGTYTDLLISESLDSGASFSFPRPISPAPRTGTGRFQTNPALAVDNDGQIEACFYDTPSDKPSSSSVYSYNCATSFTHAATWAVHRLASSAPVGYDAVTGDFLLHNDGFFTAFELQASGQRHVVSEKSDNP